ncbi:MAG: aconitate hydratase [Rikenellaceae bacterium]
MNAKIDFTQFYENYVIKTDKTKSILAKPLTLAEKVLYAHLFDSSQVREFKRAEEYVEFKPDRVAMQDATAQMALLQFMNAGKSESMVSASVHCDHLIEAYKGEQTDLEVANDTNSEVYSFLKSVASKYGIDYWKPGAGIIHQVVLENYAMPGAMMLGTDSHTPNAGGLSMIAIGVGGADAVDVMVGMPWELKMPKLIGVKLTGKLSGWCSAKDVILKLAGILTVKGGTNSIIEYFGEGVATLSATGRATMCNMGAEVGATTSIFGFDAATSEYLAATGRGDIAAKCNEIAEYLNADKEVTENPEKYYDRLIEIDLSAVEPHLNGPFTPDLAHTINSLKEAVEKNDYPTNMEVGLIGSCTNSSYNDMARAASIARDAVAKGIKPKAQLLINPGSELVKATAERDGILSDLKEVGAVIMANACGACIGQWKREPQGSTAKNAIVTSFNRNFAKRADGNPNTYAFVASPEMVMAMTLAGDLKFNPLKDKLINENGEEVMLSEPKGDILPKNGFVECDKGLITPSGSDAEVVIAEGSARLQKLEPFTKWDGKDLVDMPMLIKCEGKCTTDHISMAGKWLRFRGHLQNISDNLLLGAVNYFTKQTGEAYNTLTKEYGVVSDVAKDYKSKGIGSFVIAEDNYGEGSSREHAAMEPRFLNVKAVIVKSFARIHETNLKKQGLLALTFANPADYDLFTENVKGSIVNLSEFAQGEPLKMELSYPDGTSAEVMLNHTYNPQQIEWFKAGSALNWTGK